MLEQGNLIDILKKTSEKFHNKKAVVMEDEFVTYEQLYKLSDVYLSYLQKKMTDNKVVCVICKRSIRLCACVLGIIQAGGCYVLYEPEDLNENIIENIKNISPGIIFMEEEICIFENIVLMETVEKDNSDKSIPNSRNLNDLLYMVSTSGTTGRGKIIPVRDKNILCYLNGYVKAIGVDSSDIVLQQSPIYYDGFAEEFLSMLLVGGTIVLTKSTNLKIPRKLIELVNRYNITILPSTPLIIEEINRLNKPFSLKALVSSGDVLRKSQINCLLNNCRVYNMYGLSETTVCATCYKCIGDENGNIPIGEPIDGYNIVLLDECGNIVEQNDRGEIYIGGEGVFEGYFLAEDSEKFIVDIDGKKYFKTGDYGWKDQKGILYYIGRCDRQIKVRGNRVDLNEIENIILEQELIDKVAVVYFESNRIMCAFYVSDSIEESEVRKNCEKKMATYMRPNRYIRVSSIPIKKTGKVDYGELEKIYNDTFSCCAVEEDRNISSIEQYVFDIIRKITNCNNLDYDDEWEDVGVDSLSYIMIISEIEEHYLQELSDDFLLHSTFSTIGEFCRNVDVFLRKED